MNFVCKDEKMVDCDPDDLTDGEMADYTAAQLSGDYGDWREAITIYECPRCNILFQYSEL